MENATTAVRWLIVGMGQVLGITPSVTPPTSQCATVIEAIGGDFHAVGNDFRVVITRHPPNVETASQLGVKAKQLELAGIS